MMSHEGRWPNSSEGSTSTIKSLDPREPSELALWTASQLAYRIKNRPNTPVRRSFTELTPGINSGLKVPPLAQLIRGGRGGSVRLRLLLALLWIAAAPPYEVRMPARAWAQLLDLPDPAGKGARRVADATRWLQQRSLIEVVPNEGGSNTLRILNEAGNEQPYEPPGAAYQRLRDDPAAAGKHLYVRLPSTLWTYGWMAVLSPAAIAMLIILYVQLGRSGTAGTSGAVWISPSYAKESFKLSDETRARGLRELEVAGLVTVQRRELDASNVLAERRFRNVYRIEPQRFERKAFVPADNGPVDRSSRQVEGERGARRIEPAHKAE
ncbi:hypothetical protein [Kribbella speibonae]|uniref:Uncharacterized protein n=1 Tax=Kribbella speibonae TaxID=1572660 RepID=A0A4R0IFK3_9ACTN|nr:hypothetical protein [Kribbella speibonae]TCC32043.1 hypothetical protein E0H92_36710 [Kribbella speibonae]